MLIDSLKNSKEMIDALYNKMKSATPKELRGSFKGKFTDTVPVVGFRAIEDRKQLPPTRVGATLIQKHYNKKGIYYIQIGGSGFYYIGKDILGLGVPELDEEFVTEIRIKPSGVKNIGGIEKVTVQIIATGRISKKPTQSPYTLERTEDIIKLFGAKS
jgi:hypothetical protein